MESIFFLNVTAIKALIDLTNYSQWYILGFYRDPL